MDVFQIDFLEVIKHPQIGTKQKKKTFINIFKGKIDEELLDHLKHLADTDSLSQCHRCSI